MKNRLLIAGLLIIANFFQSTACTIIAVGKKATRDGSVIISHTDTGPDSRIFVVPAKTFRPGDKASVYWGIQDASLPLLDDGEILGYIPADENIREYDLTGKPILDLPDRSPSIAAVQGILETLGLDRAEEAKQ